MTKIAVQNKWNKGGILFDRQTGRILTFNDESGVQEYFKQNPRWKVDVELVELQPSKILAIFDGNWADEMDIHGLRIFSSLESWETFAASVPDKKFEISVGSNEDLNFSNRADYLGDISIRQISDEQALTLREILDISYGDEWGEFPELDFDDEEDDD